MHCVAFFCVIIWIVVIIILFQTYMIMLGQCYRGGQPEGPLLVGSPRWLPTFAYIVRLWFWLYLSVLLLYTLTAGTLEDMCACMYVHMHGRETEAGWRTRAWQLVWWKMLPRQSPCMLLIKMGVRWLAQKRRRNWGHFNVLIQCSLIVLLSFYALCVCEHDGKWFARI